MKLWYTNNSPFTSYTTITLHSDSRSDFSAYVTSHVRYTTYKFVLSALLRTRLLLEMYNIVGASLSKLIQDIMSLMSDVIAASSQSFSYIHAHPFTIRRGL